MNMMMIIIISLITFIVLLAHLYLFSWKLFTPLSAVYKEKPEILGKY
jgi:hypothetical protein